MIIEGRYGPSCAVAGRQSGDLQISNPSSRSSTPFQFPFPSFSGAFSPGLSHEGVGEGSSRPSSSILSLLQQQGLIASSMSDDASMFRCSICMAVFPSAWLLEQHTSLQHTSPQSDGEAPEDKPFKCDQCGQSYRYRSAYLKHREQNHRARLPADKLFTCDVCGMQFRYLKSFKKHRLNHALEKLHSRSPSELDLFSRATKQDVSSFRGGMLESPTDYSNRMLAMMMHQRRFNGDIASPTGRVTAPPTVVTDIGSDQVSSSNEAVVSSPPASSSTAFERAASAPISKTEQQNFYKFSIDDYFCNSNLSDKKPTKLDGEQDETIDSLALALSMASNGGSDAFRSAQEVSLLNLLRMDAVERQRERRFSCPFCGKCVRSKENLKLHVRKHTGERPFVCLFCGRAFGGKSDLTRHLRIHTGERPYHCEMCGKCFARADYLSKHLTTHIHNSQR